MTKQQLIEDNMNLVYFLIHQQYPDCIGDEDIVQCGMLGLCKAAELWDETKSKFSTFAMTCIKNEIRQEFRRRNKHWGILSLDLPYNTGGDNPGNQNTLSDYIVGDEDVAYDHALDINVSHLTAREKRVFDLFRSGMTQSEVGAELGISRQAVWNVMRKIRVKNSERG